MDEIWDFIELVSEGFPTDSCVCLFLSLLVLKGGIWDLTVLAPDHCLFFLPYLQLFIARCISASLS